MEHVLLKARAKINLALDVRGRRPDGYHELASVMQSVTLADNVFIKKVRRDNFLKLATNLSFLPSDQRNLAYQAAKLLMDRYSVTEGIFMQIDKHIPVSAGLAGGSADCAAVLVGLRGLLELPVKRSELMELGLQLGADVPFCVMRGTALAEGVGERLTRLRPMPNAWILLARPPVIISTAEIFKAFDKTGKPSSGEPDVERMLRYVHNSDLHGMCSCMANALESVTAVMHPIIYKLKETMMEQGALGALMSGSGPTVFGVFNSRERADTARSKLRERFPDVREIFLTRTFNVY